MAAKNTKTNIFYASKEYIATIVDTDTLADGFYGTVFLNKGTAFTVTLGTAADNSEKSVKLINIGAGTVTISDGATVVTLVQYACASVVCNGTDWYLSSYFQSYMTDVGTEINNRKLSVFNATSSSELAGVISDETGSGLLVFGTSPVFADKITIGTASGTTGYFELKGTISGVVTVTVNDAAGTYTLTLPDTDGNSDQILKTDGSGNLSWADNATSSGTSASFSETIGDTSETEFTITHNLGSRDIIVNVYEVASPYAKVYPEIEHTSINTAVITFTTAPGTNEYRVVILKGGYALPTTSAELANIISDETGTAFVVFSDSPIFTTNITTPIVRTPQIKTDATTPTDLTITTGAAKTLVLATPVYKDINIAGILLTKPAASVPTVVNFVDKNAADTGIPTYGFAIGEKIAGGFEMQHDYKEATDIVFHVHWQGIAAPSGTDNVQWRLTYIFFRDNVVLEPAVIIDSPDTAIDTQYKSYRSDFAAISGASLKIGDQFMFVLERVAATGDVYAGDALIETAGIHYLVDTIGSRAIATK